MPFVTSHESSELKTVSPLIAAPENTVPKNTVPKNTAPKPSAMMPARRVENTEKTNASDASAASAANMDAEPYRAKSIEEIEELRIRHYERASRFTKLRRAAERDIKRVATDEDMELLYQPNNLYLWYRAAESIKVRAQHHAMMKRVDLDSLDEAARVRELSEDEAKQRQELKISEAKRRYFIGKVDEKLGEISAIMHPQGMTGQDRMVLSAELRTLRDEIQLGDNEHVVDELMRIIRDLEHDNLS